MLEYFISGGFIVAIVGALIWHAIRSAKKETELQIKNEGLEDENKILKRQRDNNVNSVDDADRVWDELDKRKD